MGYTHYYSRHSDKSNSAEAYTRFREGAERIIVEAHATGITIGDGFGERPGYWENTDSRVAFNGVGDDAHETFGWDQICGMQPDWRKGEAMYFDFCKTAQKPYDAVVTACLLWLAECYGDAVEISSDGYWNEWQAGRDLFRTVFGYDAKPPFVVEEMSV